MTVALTCPRCGAPLPLPQGPYVSCAYCGASSNVGSPASVTPPDPAREVAAIEAFKVTLAKTGSAYDALAGAARLHLGPFGETDALARVVLALARDFDAAHKTAVARDPMAMARLIKGYLAAIEGIRATGAHRVHLSFFTATGKGPVDYDRTLTAADVAALCARDPRR